ncbi:MAG: ComEC/Rec2 family competence protein [Parcubacteria group bacterium]
MKHKKYIYILIAGLLALSLILAAIIFSSRNQKLKVIFLDVGQGDAILIEKGTNQILIDGGASSQKELEELGKYIPFWDREIETVIVTHPDQDHIGGLIGVLKSYRVCSEVDNFADGDSEAYKNYLQLISDKKIERLRGEGGMNIKLDDATLSLLYPGTDLVNNSKDTNADSIVAKLTTGQNIFLFTGDFPTTQDARIFASGVDLSATVLKVAHHGSKYATSDEFLDRVKPREAIISVGANNRYGHPAPEVLDKLKARGILIKRTDQVGDIVYNF